jgi:hypothetical protein
MAIIQQVLIGNGIEMKNSSTLSIKRSATLMIQPISDLLVTGSFSPETDCRMIGRIHSQSAMDEMSMVSEGYYANERHKSNRS